MIFIKISKKSIMWICSIICVVLVLGTSMFGVVKFKKLNNIVKDKDEEIKKIQQENCKLIEEYQKSEKWLKIKDDRIGELEEVVKEYEEKLKEFESKSVPKIDTSKKTYMDYCRIKKGSEQGEIVYGSEAWTDKDGLRMWGEYYCVALGSYYGNVGDKFLVETDKGNKYKIIKADEKADKHTDSSNRYTLASGCMMEWIVETSKLSTYVKRSGNINNIDKVSGHIVKIIKIEG